ncbi:MAG: cryptochrome/photolyase family protein [Flavobacteriaceae bacterium]
MEVRLVLGDQLNTQHSWFKTTDNQVTYVLMEMRQETDYVVHHIQKVVAFFGAMRQFDQTLVQQEHRVHYLKIEDPENRQDLSRNLKYL